MSRPREGYVTMEHFNRMVEAVVEDMPRASARERMDELQRRLRLIEGARSSDE